MVMEIIRSMLGPLVVILDFFSTHPEILTVILALWMVSYAAGHYQMKAIERKTIRFVVDRSRLIVAANPQTSLAELRARILPVWLEEIKQWNFKFIPHKFDFWPVPMTPENVQLKLPLSHEWLAKVIKSNGISLSGETIEVSAKNSK